MIVKFWVFWGSRDKMCTWLFLIGIVWSSVVDCYGEFFLSQTCFPPATEPLYHHQIYLVTISTFTVMSKSLSKFLKVPKSSNFIYLSYFHLSQTHFHRQIDEWTVCSDKYLSSVINWRCCHFRLTLVFPNTGAVEIWQRNNHLRVIFTSQLILNFKNCKLKKKH